MTAIRVKAVSFWEKRYARPGVPEIAITKRPVDGMYLGIRPCVAVFHFTAGRIQDFIENILRFLLQHGCDFLVGSFDKGKGFGRIRYRRKPGIKPVQKLMTF